MQLSVLDHDLAVPPASPIDGDRYIFAANPSGVWAGQQGRIAAYQDGVWAFYAAEKGWLAWAADEDVLLVFDGGAWVAASVSPAALATKQPLDSDLAEIAALTRLARRRHLVQFNYRKVP